jgi:hypothetical protein
MNCDAAFVWKRHYAAFVRKRRLTWASVWLCWISFSVFVPLVYITGKWGTIVEIDWVRTQRVGIAPCYGVDGTGI